MAINLFAQTEDTTIEKSFSGHKGVFVVYDSLKGTFYHYNEKRCREYFLPASTFKIPNSIIGLETGVIEDEKFVIKWDGKERSIKEWNRDNDLASAIKYSVVPYYQELARRVGREKMQEYLNNFNYGNKTIGNRIDTFWLDNSLKITPDGEVNFLRKFYSYNLPASKRSIDIVKKIISKEEYPKSTLYFKTGTGNTQEDAWVAWLVGYVEKGTNVYFYGFNVEGSSFREVSDIRNKAPREILKYLKIIE